MVFLKIAIFLNMNMTYKVIFICSECNLYILYHCIGKPTLHKITLITIPSQYQTIISFEAQE